jgi:uncharacterized protein YdaU (DUF1376 family)
VESTMASVPYVRFFWSDWIADTSHLDLMQLGAYMRLLEHVYQHGRPLPGDIQRVFRICHATSATEQETIRGILAEYFQPFEDPEHGPQWRHLRAEREIEWSQKAHASRVNKALLAAGARWSQANDAPSNAPSMSQAFTKQCSSNANQNQNQNQDKKEAYASCPKVASATSKPEPRNGVPYAQIRDLWCRTLPMLRKPLDVEHWTPARKAIIRSRWADQLPDLEAWEATFRKVARSKFLCGQAQTTPGRKPFEADLFWVAKPENLLKLYEGKYTDG